MKFCTDWWVYYAFAETSITLLNVGPFFPPHVEFLGITFVFPAGRLAMSELSGTLRSRGIASPMSSRYSQFLLASMESDALISTAQTFQLPLRIL
jgi:hypothetical protein